MAPNHPQSPAGAPNGREAAPVTEGDVPPQPIVCIRNLRKVRRTSDHQFELVVPAFDVFPGEFVVIIGSSGCGKSTLLDMLGLILACDKGEETFSLGFRDSSYAQVRKLSERSRARLRRRHFGYVLQSGGLLKFLSAKANALLSCRLNGLKNGARAVADLARQVEMEKHLAPRPASLSGGQRQRTAIIRALAHDPEVVLADEPTASLDQLLAAKVLDELQAAARERGTAVIMVTHDSKLVAGKADRVYTFTVETAAPPKGVEDATRSTMLENPDHPARAPWPALNGSAAAGDNGAEAALDDGAEAAVEIDLAGDLDGKPTPAEAAEIAAIDGLVRVQMEMLGEAEGASVQVEDRSGAPLIEEVEGEPANPPEDPHVGTPGEGEIPPAPTPPPAPAPKANARDRHRRSGGPSALFRHIVLMVRLALADVRHEWLMNLCLILALVAVIAPLLLGLGLKSGLIKRIFDGFEHDPRYYEIASAGNPQQTTELLAFLKDRPEVEVVVRRLGAISGSVYVDAVVRGAEERPVPGFGTMDLEATEGKDKLLLLSGAVAPLDDTPSTGATGAVLNEAAAAKLSGGADPVQPGDILKIRVTRTVAGRLQEAPWQLRVQSIARLRSDANTVQPARLFVPLSLTEDVELFKTGSPVEARQWLGGARTPAAPVFDAAIVVLRPQVGGNAPKDAVPPKIFLREVVGVSGWAEPRILTAAQLTEQTGLQFAQLKEGEGGDVIGYVSSKGGEGAVAGDFVDLREFFRGRGYIPPAAGAGATGYSGIVAIIPWVAPRPMEFRRSGGISPSLEAAGYSADAATVHFLGLKPEPPWPAPGAPAAPAAAGEAAAPAAIAKILLPPGAGRAGEAASLMVAQRGGGEVAVPITAAGGDSASAKFAYLPAETAGLLRLAAGGDVVWVESSRQFYPRRARYAGFRLYTKKFEQVIDLEHALQMRGAEVQTQAAEISGAIELNHRLTALVQVTALVGGLGAVAVLAFSLFGSVERKRGDFAILRLIGTGRLPLLVFPIFESMTLAVLAYLVAWWGVFSPVASWINRTIGPRFGFQSQEALCWLPLDLALSGLALTLVVSIVVAIGAGWRAMLADPAAALRQE